MTVKEISEKFDELWKIYGESFLPEWFDDAVKDAQKILIERYINESNAQ